MERGLKINLKDYMPFIPHLINYRYQPNHYYHKNIAVNQVPLKQLWKARFSYFMIITKRYVGKHPKKDSSFKLCFAKVVKVDFTFT